MTTVSSRTIEEHRTDGEALPARDGAFGSYDTNPSATLTGRAKARYVSGMFGRIARRYDLMNTLISFGQDARWRRYAVQQARPRPGGLALDVATGTGRIARELARKGARTLAVDFSPEMMLAGIGGQGPDRFWILDFGFWIRGREQIQNPKSKIQNKETPDPWPLTPIYFIGGDALELPFADCTFDCVTSGFAMRNVIDIRAAFREMYRVVKPGGRVVCLEVGRSRWAVARALHAFYTGKVVPLLGRLIAGDADAYTYLPNSMRRFPPPEELAWTMRACGLREVRFKQLTFGAVAVHSGVK